jgi:hypothetical protein
VSRRSKAARSTHSRRNLAATVDALGELGKAIDQLDACIERLRASAARAVLHRIGTGDARSIDELASTLTMVTSIVHAVDGALPRPS